MRNKGKATRTWLNINGAIEIRRHHFHGKQEGTLTPVDALLDVAEALGPGQLRGDHGVGGGPPEQSVEQTVECRDEDD